MSFLKRLSRHDLLTPFQIFKYAIYFLLLRNLWLFYVEESASILVMHPNGFGFSDIANVYAATIDTCFWILLLFLFELETWIIPDEKLTPPVKVTFSGLRAVCYASIVYALYGYFRTYLELSDWETSAAMSANLCANIGDSFMFSLERFESITAENCAALAQSNDFLVNKESMITDSHHFHISWMLAIADVVNASDWLLVVLILEAEVWLQTQGMLTPGKLGVVKLTKIILYALLGIIAIFWGIYGEFIDFWDAFLWIVAFIFIENNVLQWNKESHEATIAPTSGLLDK